MGLNNGSTGEEAKEQSRFETKTVIETTVVFRGNTVDIDDAVWKQQVSEEGEYHFWAEVDNDVVKWYIEDTEVDLADYGISVTGDVVSGDEVYVIYNGEEIDNYGYNEFTSLADNVDFDYIDFKASLPIDVEIGEGFFRGWMYRVKFDMGAGIENGFVWVRNGNGQDVNIKLVLATKKVVEEE
jgi:hypothetical protein